MSGYEQAVNVFAVVLVHFTDDDLVHGIGHLATRQRSRSSISSDR